MQCSGWLDAGTLGTVAGVDTDVVSYSHVVSTTHHAWVLRRRRRRRIPRVVRRGAMHARRITRASQLECARLSRRAPRGVA
jgi:hypothetical protein